MHHSRNSVSASQTPLSHRLKVATKQIHTTAERTGFVADLLKAAPERDKYILYLDCLHTLYLHLETALLENQCAAPQFIDSAMHRRHAIKSDLKHLRATPTTAGQTMPALQSYVSRIHFLAQNEPVLLNAHAYVRYFGDLSGGQILHKIVKSTYNLQHNQLAFYRFESIPDTDVYKQKLKLDLDANTELARVAPDLEREAVRTFQFNIDLSIGIADHQPSYRQ